MIIELFIVSATLMFTSMIYETYVLAKQDWVINRNTPVYNLTMSKYWQSSFCDEFKKVFYVYIVITLLSLLIGWVFSTLILTLLLGPEGIEFIITVGIVLALSLLVVDVMFVTTYSTPKIVKLFYKTKKTVSETTFSENCLKFKEMIKDKYCPIVKRED